MELGAEEDRDERKLRASIRCCRGARGAGKAWALEAEKNRLCVCVCVCPSIHSRTDREKGRILWGRTSEDGKRRLLEELCQGGVVVDGIMEDGKC